MGCSPGSSGGGPQLLPQPGDPVVTLSPCASGPCMNGGTCIPLANSFMCQCSSGFNGFMCQTQIDNCANRPCLNGGTCTNGIGTYSCQCTAEFTGNICQEEVQVCGGIFTGEAGEIDYPIGKWNFKISLDTEMFSEYCQFVFFRKQI